MLYSIICTDGLFAKNQSNKLTAANFGIDSVKSDLDTSLKISAQKHLKE